MYYLIFLFSVFFAISAIWIYKKSVIFTIPYILLFFYTIFTQIAYLFYPEKLNLYSSGQYYGEDLFLPYWTYVFLSFVVIFLLFLIFYSKNYTLKLRLEISKETIHMSSILYLIFIILYHLILLFFLTKNYSELSYYTQHILKENKLWFYLFSLEGIVLFSIFIKIFISINVLRKIFWGIVFFIGISIFLITSIRSGQRIELAEAILAFIGFYLVYYKGVTKKKIFFLTICMVFSLMFSQGVRSLRGSNIELKSFIDYVLQYNIFSFFSLENIVFQDWVVPSATLFTSMYKTLIIPETVTKSNLLILIPLIKRPSLGGILSRIIDPYGWTGYGYYILTEGYNLMGFMGFLYSAFIFTFGIRLLELFFCKTEDNVFNSYMCGILSFISLNIVRGQSASIIKGIYFYFIPGIILFSLLSGRKIYLSCK